MALPPSLVLDTGLLGDSAGLVRQIELLEAERHGDLSASPFMRRYGSAFLRRCEPSILAQLYAQSFCNIGQVNTSHAGDCARRRVVGPDGIELIPYSAGHVAAVCGWFVADEDLQDAFGVSGDADERAVQASDARARDRQTFLIRRAGAGAAAELVGQIRLCLTGQRRGDHGGDDGGGDGSDDDAHAASSSIEAHVPIAEAEVELLIGAAGHRRQGLGRAALRLLAHYAHFVHGCGALSSVVEECNDAAVAFFRGVGFAEISRDDASETLRFEARGGAFQALLHRTGKWESGAVRLCVSDDDASNDGGSGRGGGGGDDDQGRQASKVQRLKCTRVDGERILLVPYQRDHVREYHVRCCPRTKTAAAAAAKMLRMRVMLSGRPHPGCGASARKYDDTFCTRVQQTGACT
jgi:ribosomal protein S18 acetylase RimI-like enzyme